MSHSTWPIHHGKIVFRLFAFKSVRSFSNAFFLSRFPFNWKTPLGYLIAFSSQCLQAYATISSLLPMICYLAGSCWLLVHFARDSTHDLSLFTINSSPNKDAEGRMKEQFCNIIKFHGDLIELSFETFQFVRSGLLNVISFKCCSFHLDWSKI